MNILLSTFKDMAESLKAVGQVFSNTWFIILPVAFYFVFKLLWLDHVQKKFLSSIEYTLLEIISPRDIEKSPKLMEALFSGISGVWKSLNVKEIYFRGELLHRFSFEIVSDGGIVHFYIRTPKVYRNLIEANLYAQYPTVEINEVPDYVKNVPHIVPNRNWDLWGSDFELTKPDAYPIRTYRKFEESVTGKMIDPLASIIEVMGKVSPNHKLWLQYIIVPEAETWSNSGQQLIDEVFKGKAKPKGILGNIISDFSDVLNNIFSGIMGNVEFEAELKKDDRPIEFRLTPGEKEVLKALEENIGKNVYEVKMRFLYLGQNEGFDKTFIASFVGAIKQFNDQNINGFKPENDSKTFANYILTRSRLRYRQRKIFQRYIDRDMTGKKFILSSEELATVFHIPDMSVMAPSIFRVESKRGGAPSNLPI